MASRRSSKTNVVPQSTAPLPAGYGTLLEDIKARIRTAQVKAALSANRELILVYWEIGKRILEQQEQEGWGAKVIDRLAYDLRREFPQMKGFSPRNLKYMRAFAHTYPQKEFVQEVLAQITWYHNITLLDKVKDPVKREWYVRQTIEHGWSRAVPFLVGQHRRVAVKVIDPRGNEVMRVHRLGEVVYDRA